jgi:hypothetical protein
MINKILRGKLSKARDILGLCIIGDWIYIAGGRNN